MRRELIRNSPRLSNADFSLVLPFRFFRFLGCLMLLLLFLFVFVVAAEIEDSIGGGSEGDDMMSRDLAVEIEVDGGDKLGGDAAHLFFVFFLLASMFSSISISRKREPFCAFFASNAEMRDVFVVGVCFGSVFI